MKSTPYKIIEFLILFILAPISFVFKYPFQIKLVIGVLGFIYVLFILLKVERKKLKIEPNLNYKSFAKTTGLKLLGIGILTTLFVWFTNKDVLFIVVLNNPKLWVFILFFYSLFSVYPQELIYRTFYFKRYKSFFKNQNIFMLCNAMVFALAHLLFKNVLVLVLTGLGGLLFAFTYNKTKSTLLVSIEHAIYGCWIFTAGMGDILGFPQN